VSGVPIVALSTSIASPWRRCRRTKDGYAALAKTPFYLEAGGQVPTRRIVNEATGALASVEGLVRIAGAAAGAPRSRDIGRPARARHRQR
jgi:hypothetical protein